MNKNELFVEINCTHLDKYMNPGSINTGFPYKMFSHVVIYAGVSNPTFVPRQPTITIKMHVTTLSQI